MCVLAAFLYAPACRWPFVLGLSLEGLAWMSAPALLGPPTLRSLHWWQNVRLDLVAVGQDIGLVEQAGDGEHFAKCLGVGAKLSQSSGVRVDAVRAAVGGRNGQGGDLAGFGIEVAFAAGGFRVHQRLELPPDQVELVGVAGQCSPEVRHEVDLFGALDVVKNLADLASGGIFIDQANGGRRHGSSEVRGQESVIRVSTWREALQNGKKIVGKLARVAER